jgi:hypothetical protein
LGQRLDAEDELLRRDELLMLSFLRRRAMHRPASRGQALVEFALILPLFIMVLTGVIVLGIIVFYNQQLTNAAREAARFASVHSATSLCPTVGHRNPSNPPQVYSAFCDSVDDSWPKMTPFARSKVFGLNPANVIISACWSGYQEGGIGGAIDARPPGVYSDGDYTANEWAECTIDGSDPTEDPSAIGCAPGLLTVDEASSASEGPGRFVANRVSVYACMQWQPPMAGFLLIPDTVTLRAVISEPIQRQQ